MKRDKANRQKVYGETALKDALKRAENVYVYVYPGDGRVQTKSAKVSKKEVEKIISEGINTVEAVLDTYESGRNQLYIKKLA